MRTYEYIIGFFMSKEKVNKRKLETTNQSQNLESDQSVENIDIDSKQNLSSFFLLLLEIDKRNNPKLYKNNNKNEYEKL